ncbi:hypothetical protein ACWGJB_46090 [Streptomyces sp. NPDC054813]
MPKFYARRRAGILATLPGLTAPAALFDSPSASAAFPTPASASTARTYLTSFTVATEKTGRTAAPDTATNLPAEARGL